MGSARLGLRCEACDRRAECGEHTAASVGTAESWGCWLLVVLRAGVTRRAYAARKGDSGERGCRATTRWALELTGPRLLVHRV